MRFHGRLLGFGAICAGALWLVATPASALTLSVGGTTPVVGPISVPLPTTSVTVGSDGPVAVGVQAPGSTAVSVKAGPSGLSAKATAAQTPLVDVGIGTPDLANPPAPVPAIPPVSNSGPAPSIVGAPTSSPTPAAPASRAGADTNNDSVGPRVHLAPGAPVLSPTERDISSVRHRAGDHAAKVTASIASSPRAGFLSSLPDIGARLMLWLLLAGVVVALRLFVGSATSKAPRAS